MFGNQERLENLMVWTGFPTNLGAGLKSPYFGVGGNRRWNQSGFVTCLGVNKGIVQKKPRGETTNR